MDPGPRYELSRGGRLEGVVGRAVTSSSVPTYGGRISYLGPALVLQTPCRQEGFTPKALRTNDIRTEKSNVRALHGIGNLERYVT